MHSRVADLPVTLLLSVLYGEVGREARLRIRLAGILQDSHVDVYLNGAKRIADGKFVRVRGEESGILNDDAENN